MGNSSSNASSVPCGTSAKAGAVRRPVFGTLSHSIASSLTTTDTTDSAPSSSLSSSTHQSSHSNHTTDDELASYYRNQSSPHIRQQARNVYCEEEEEYLNQRSASFNDDVGTASSFELIVPHGLYTNQRVPPEHRPHSVLGLGDSLYNSPKHRSVSSLSSSTSSSLSAYDQQSYSHVYQCPDFILPSRTKKALRDDAREGNGIRVPVMPLPRSKSFHQILRPTVNGHMLASNGTIRGASSSSKSKQLKKVQLSPQPVPQLDSKVKTANLNGHNKGKDLLSNNNAKHNNELESILRSRLCQSESNLHHSSTNDCSQQLTSKTSANRESQLQSAFSQTRQVSLVPEPSANYLHQVQYRSEHSSPSFKLPCRAVARETSSKPSNGNNNATGAVKIKIQRVKQHRPPPPPIPTPRGSSHQTSPQALWNRELLALGSHISSSTQELPPSWAEAQAAQQAMERSSCKIKRSVSNFDASVFFKNRDLDFSQNIPQTLDNPWKLQRPTYDTATKNGLPPDWYSQYLSFEFLNERIKSRLQQEIDDKSQRLSSPSTDKSSGHSRVDSAYQTARSDECRETLHSKSTDSKFNSRFSCSEANLTTANHSGPKSKCTKTSNGLNKKKSFKKLIEHYFVANDYSSSSQDSLVSSAAYGQPSMLAHFDQNFILKRNTPNAGLTEHEQQFQQSNLKEYFDNDQPIYKKTWRKKRVCQQFNNKGAMSTIDRQLEMFENMLNQASDPCNEYDSIVVNPSKVGDSLVHRSNLSLAEHKNAPTMALNGQQQKQLNYLKLIGRSDNALCANNNTRQQKTSRIEPVGREASNWHQFWTPLNDLSSESDDGDDYDDLMVPLPGDASNASIGDQQHYENYNLLHHSIVDVDVEDFASNGQTEYPRMSQPNGSSHRQQQHSNAHFPLPFPRPAQLPSGPCFTLSNQLKTLLHNSNRLRSQNYFFY